MSELTLTPELQLSIEQFYFQEARMLDNRQYQQWFALLTEDLRYIIPSRTNPMVNNRERGNEDMISVERELEGEDSDGCPIREEGYFQLMIRVERAYKMNSWSENPPARTRRIVGNVEIMANDGDTLSIYSNFHMHYARPGGSNYLYAGQRRDTLRKAEGRYKIARREVILDYANIDYPTLGLFF
ncbi:MAG: aromatic-ring-hydroxylating dioxygenase subunit beta [Pseudomonadales bacterium]